MGNSDIMSWPWRVFIIVPNDAKAAAEQAARQVNATGPDYVGDAFTLPLSSDGQAPATHWALYAVALLPPPPIDE